MKFINKDEVFVSELSQCECLPQQNVKLIKLDNFINSGLVPTIVQTLNIFFIIKRFIENIKKQYPYLTMYNIINFYKIHLMYELGLKYDEILFLDFDVVPMKNENFFELWDLTKGIAVLNNNSKITKIKLKVAS